MTRAQGEYDWGGGQYKWRSLTPSQSQKIAEALDAGVRAADLAPEYGVSVRTIYRAARYGREPHTVVRVGDWWAEFAITDDGPVRMTAWHSALSPEDVQRFRS